MTHKTASGMSKGASSLPSLNLRYSRRFFFQERQEFPTSYDRVPATFANSFFILIFKACYVSCFILYVLITHETVIGKHTPFLYI